MPGQAHYNRISSKNLVIFHSEQEAINAGYRKAKKQYHYINKLRYLFIP